jgi:hypothetical protein
VPHESSVRAHRSSITQTLAFDPDAPPEFVELLVKWMGPAPTDEEHMETLLGDYRAFADYLESAADYLGVRVY